MSDLQYPKEWADTDDFEQPNLEAFDDFYREQEEHWDALGMPCARFTTNRDGDLEPSPRRYLEARAPGYTPNTKLVALSREASTDQPAADSATTNVVQPIREMERKIVPEAEVAALVAQGWEV